jgi:hypothetical protein
VDLHTRYGRVAVPLVEHDPRHGRHELQR